MKLDIQAIVAHCEDVLSRGSYLPSGIHSEWVDCLELTGQPVGVKFWHPGHDMTFRESRKMHLKAMMLGVGPKIYREVEIQGQKGLVMERITIAREIIDNKCPNTICYEDIYQAYGDKVRQRNLRQMKREEDEKRERFEKFLRSQLCEIITKVEKTGIEVYDTHCKNWGFVYGSTEFKASEVRIVDVGNFIQNEVDGRYLTHAASCAARGDNPDSGGNWW